jgi:DNA-3-methyladenine glycosylase II
VAQHTTTAEVRGPWSLARSKHFWEGFAPATLSSAADPEGTLHTVFVSTTDWTRVETTVTQHGTKAHITVDGPGDLAAAVEQVRRFLAIDIDGRGWADVGRRDPVIAEAQRQYPGLRPCGFHSPYEAAAWAVLSQRVRITQAARLRDQLVERHGDHGAFPAPQRLRTLDLDLPGRKTEYLHAVAEAALDGVLDFVALRSVDSSEAIAAVQQVKGLGPFAAELVVLRGANAPDALPAHEQRLAAEITERYGATARLDEVSRAWRPYRTWAALHLRVLREQRTQEIGG